MLCLAVTNSTALSIKLFNISCVYSLLCSVSGPEFSESGVLGYAHEATAA